MAEEDLKMAIQEKVFQQRETLLKQAKEEAKKIIQDAEEMASHLQKKNLLEIKKRCLLEKNRQLNAINRKVKGKRLEAKEKKIDQVFSQVEEALKALPQESIRYKPIFKELLEEALKVVGKRANLKLKVNPRDKELAEELLRELNLPAGVETEDHIMGGLELFDLEKNTVVLNTFSSRLEKLKGQLRQEVSKILFGE